MGRRCDDDDDRLPWAGDPMTTLLAAIIRRAILDARRDGVLAQEAQEFLAHIGLTVALKGMGQACAKLTE
jgi:hypothetical protein